MSKVKDERVALVAKGGAITLRRSADGSFRVDEISLQGAIGVKRQAEAAKLISRELRSRKLKTT